MGFVDTSVDARGFMESWTMPVSLPINFHGPSDMPIVERMTLMSGEL